MTILCEAIHPEFRVYCGLPRGHHTYHVGMVGKVPVMWPNSDHDETRVAKAVIYTVAGLFALGAMLAFACAVVKALV